MKKILFIILVSTLFVNESYSQNRGDSLPASTAIIPYKLDVGYYTTTLIIFPVPLVPAADRGSKEIIIQQEKALNNVLKIKADKKDFHPTNLHVYTIDGKLFVFNVNYTEYPHRTTFDLTKIVNNSDMPKPLIVNDNFKSGLNIKEIALQARYSKPFFSRKKIRFGMKLQLQTIHTVNDWVVFGFRIANRSTLDYNMDFTRMYIRDKKQVKRSSIQEQEIIPVYKDNLTTIPGEKENRFVIMVPRFTIPDKKEFLMEMFEKNGGRNITLRIKNKHLLKAQIIEISL